MSSEEEEGKRDWMRGRPRVGLTMMEMEVDERSVRSVCMSSKEISVSIGGCVGPDKRGAVTVIQYIAR